MAIAQQPRLPVPDLEVDWLVQDPVTRMLASEDERIHPASAHLASESRHIEAESAEHDLHAFQAIRRMDEILMANFMVFDDVVRRERYDLWIGDEAWELDYHLHENPRLEYTPFAWLTDFVGWLFQVRDRSIFVGNPDGVVPGDLGPGLPGIREWTEKHFDFTGYVTGYDQAELVETERIRAELGSAWLPLAGLGSARTCSAR